MGITITNSGLGGVIVFRNAGLGGSFRSRYADVLAYLLDTYTGAAAAYSLRRLRTAYTGAAIRVRRDSDSTTADIGFTASGALDETALTTFVGAGSGFVSIWYDQSGNGRNATQGTAANQPRIVNVGVVDKLNGKPAMYFDGANYFLGAATVADWNFLHFSTAYTNFTIARAGIVTDPEAGYFIWTTTGTALLQGAQLLHDSRSSVPRDRVLVHLISGGPSAGNFIAINEQSAGSTLANAQFLGITIGKPTNVTASERSALGTNNSALQKNNTYATTQVSGNANHALRFGTGANSTGVNASFLLGNIQESIFYPTDQTANLSAFRTNIFQYYAPTPLLDTYSGAAAAYSLRKLNTAYTGAAIRVRRSSDSTESDIGFTPFGDLDESALLTFVGANSGFVTRWYDQSGNGRNATQGTAANQPRIVNAGVVDRLNGKPAMFFDGSNDFLGAANVADWTFLHYSTAYTNFTVARAGIVTDPESFYLIWGTTATGAQPGAYIAHDTRSSNSADRRLQHTIGSNSATAAVVNPQANGSTNANVQFLSVLIGKPNNATASERSALGTNNDALQKNNTSTVATTTNNAFHPLRFGTAQNASSVNIFFLLGNIQESIFYPTDQTAELPNFRNNINTYYTIY